MKNILEINAVADYCKLRGQEVLHPQVGIVDFENVDESHYSMEPYEAIDFRCYTIFLKDAKGCKLKYGGKPYDYDEGTLVFVSPGQIVELGNYDPNYVPKGYAMLFHPDFLWGTELASKMNRYSFFSYSSNEALHLSKKEREILLSLLDKIEYELSQKGKNNLLHKDFYCQRMCQLHVHVVFCLLN